MVSAILGKSAAAAAAYGVRTSGQHLGFVARPLGDLIGMIKDAVQGACSGLLSFLGAMHMTGVEGAAALQSDIPVLDGVWQSITAGGMAGPVEVAGGAALFFAARRTIARTLGLLLFIAFITAYANGYTTGDILNVISQLLQSAATAIDTIPAAQAV